MVHQGAERSNRILTGLRQTHQPILGHKLARPAFITKIAYRHPRSGQNDTGIAHLRNDIIGEIGLSLDHRQVAAQRNNRRIWLHQQPSAKGYSQRSASLNPFLVQGVSAEQYNGFARFSQHSGSRLNDIVAHGRWLISSRLHRLGVGRRRRIDHVGRENQGRSSAFGLVGRGKGLPYPVGDGFRLTKIDDLPRNRLGQRMDIGCQRCIIGQVPCRMIADQVDNPRTRPACIVQIGDPIGKARAKMQQRQGHLSRHAGIAIGCARADAFEQAEHTAQPSVAGKRTDQTQFGGARIGETNPCAAVIQAVEEQVRTKLSTGRFRCFFLSVHNIFFPVSPPQPGQCAARPESPPPDA